MAIHSHSPGVHEPTEAVESVLRARIEEVCGKHRQATPRQVREALFYHKTGQWAKGPGLGPPLQKESAKRAPSHDMLGWERR